MKKIKILFTFTILTIVLTGCSLPGSDEIKAINKATENANYPEGSIVAGFDINMISNTNQDMYYEEGVDPETYGSGGIQAETGITVTPVVTDENGDSYIQSGEKLTTTVTIANTSTTDYIVYDLLLNSPSSAIEDPALTDYSDPTADDLLVLTLEDTTGFEHEEMTNPDLISFFGQDIPLDAGSSISVTYSTIYTPDQSDIKENGEIADEINSAADWVDVSFELYNDTSDYYIYTNVDAYQKLKIADGTYQA